MFNNKLLTTAFTGLPYEHHSSGSKVSAKLPLASFSLNHEANYWNCDSELSPKAGRNFSDRTLATGVQTSFFNSGKQGFYPGKNPPQKFTTLPVDFLYHTHVEDLHA